MQNNIPNQSGFPLRACRMYFYHKIVFIYENFKRHFHYFITTLRFMFNISNIVCISNNQFFHYYLNNICFISTED